jgi:hypothetical protein
MHTGREKYVIAAPAVLRKARLFMFVPYTCLLLPVLSDTFLVGISQDGIDIDGIQFSASILNWV